MAAPLQKTQRGRDAAQSRRHRRAPRHASPRTPIDGSARLAARSGRPGRRPHHRASSPCSGRQAISAVSRLIQAKLTVGGANDRYEQEADRVAESVVAMPATEAAGPAPLAASATPSETGPDDSLGRVHLASGAARRRRRRGRGPDQAPGPARRPKKRKRSRPSPGPARRRRGRGRGPDQAPGPARRPRRRGRGPDQACPRGRGRRESLLSGRESPQPWSSGCRRFGAAERPFPAACAPSMEPRFGADFGGVRLHADSEAGTVEPRSAGPGLHPRQRHLHGRGRLRAGLAGRRPPAGPRAHPRHPAIGPQGPHCPLGEGHGRRNSAPRCHQDGL